MQDNLDTVDQARAHAGALHKAWWNLYMKSKDSKETGEAETLSRTFRAEVLTKFGKPNPKYPDCRECISGSVFGGPSHEASQRCKSGRGPHCTCDTCF